MPEKKDRDRPCLYREMKGFGKTLMNENASDALWTPAIIQRGQRSGGKMPRNQDFDLFDVIPSHCLGLRSTKVRELSTGKEIEFMDALPKGEAIKQFKRHFSME